MLCAKRRPHLCGLKEHWLLSKSALEENSATLQIDDLEHWVKESAEVVHNYSKVPCVQGTTALTDSFSRE